MAACSESINCDLSHLNSIDNWTEPEDQQEDEKDNRLLETTTMFL